MSKESFKQVKSNRRSQGAIKIKTDRMRYKKGQKERSIAAKIYNESKRIDLKYENIEKTEQNKVESREWKQKKESGRNPMGAKSEKRN